jgi:excisionase family DNA binding protein
VLEAKLKLTLAKVQVMIAEKGVRTRLSCIQPRPAVDMSNVEKRQQSESLLLRVTKVAQLLGVSRSKCYEMIAAGEIPSVKLGDSLRVRRVDLENWLENGIG